MKKIILPLVTAISIPCFSLTNKQTNYHLANSKNNELKTPVDNSNDEEKSACTLVYIGKDLTLDHIPIIARCVDLYPTNESSLRIYQRDELANTTFTGDNGYTYTFPSHTAKCVVAPLNPYVGVGSYCDNCGVNEYGVAMTATLTCYANGNLGGALEADPYAEKGITEGTMTHTVLPVVKTAREGAQMLCDIVNNPNIGSSESNAILFADQKEVWYVELYTGHRCVAVKLPEDKMFVLGNEFGLHTLTEFGNDVIKSDHLEEGDFIKRDGSGNINLFDSYARPLDPSLVEGGAVTVDGPHRRTWRGLNLFGSEKGKKYDTKTEYEFMFKSEKNDFTVDDVIGIFRDRFDNILETHEDPSKDDPNHAAFLKDYNDYHLRFIACERSSNVHILKVDPDADPSMAAQMWLALSPARFAPFLPFNATITDATKKYLTVSPDAYYNDKSAYWIFETLNAIAELANDYDKLMPGYQKSVTDSLNECQRIWELEFDQVYQYAKTLNDEGKRSQLFTNYGIRAQEEALEAVDSLSNDSLHFYMNINVTSADKNIFHPLVNIERYAKKFGYAYKKTTDGANVSKDDKTYTIVMPGSTYGSYGLLKLNGEIVYDKLHADYKNGVVYIDFPIAKEYIGSDAISPMDMNEFMPKNNILVWLLPTILVPTILIGGGLAFYFIYYKKRKIKTEQPTNISNS
ncbi:MAG: C69 family dipeptidase [Bacilli bacterium]|nr:C69 family dipeptidase [Bacilli bacterium]